MSGKQEMSHLLFEKHAMFSTNQKLTHKLTKTKNLTNWFDFWLDLWLAAIFNKAN